MAPEILIYITVQIQISAIQHISECIRDKKKTTK